MKTIITCLAVCILSSLFMSSCTKSDLTGPGSSYHRVRLYDDTLPDPRNNSIYIAAGNGRLLMTYGHNYEQLLFSNGTAIFPPAAENIWMLTDNEGNLIRKDTFPSGLSVGNVISLPDNSFFIVMYTGTPNLWGGPEWTLQIMRLDPNGVMGPVSLLNVPTFYPQPYQQIYDILLWPVHDGNVLISFYYGATGGYATFVGEMDTQGNFIWYRENETHSVTDCVSTPDGGYMVSGGIYDQVLGKSDILVMKTNSTFDSTWSRLIVIEHGAVGIQIASADNGNYWLNYSSPYDGKDNIHLLKINAGGEIVDSTSYPLTPYLYTNNLSTVMLQQGTSGIFLSHSLNISNGIQSVSEQFNTTYVTLDADLNITHQSVFQDQTSDMLNSGCRTSDGRIACFGLIQSYDRRYYKPELIIIN